MTVAFTIRNRVGVLEALIAGYLRVNCRASEREMSGQDTVRNRLDPLAGRRSSRRRAIGSFMSPRLDFLDEIPQSRQRALQSIVRLNRVEAVLAPRAKLGAVCLC